jgi:hypothetical protein
MRLPNQSPPVLRHPSATHALQTGVGAVASQTACDHLRGMAQQMCYAVKYGVSM